MTLILPNFKTLMKVDGQLQINSPSDFFGLTKPQWHVRNFSYHDLLISKDLYRIFCKSAIV